MHQVQERGKHNEAGGSQVDSHGLSRLYAQHGSPSEKESQQRLSKDLNQK
jgi:hypothetical protein